MGKHEKDGQGKPVRPSFTGVVKGLFDSAELQSMAGEVIGFQGDLANRIAGWQEKGLGRIIGIPLSSGSRESSNLDPHQQYRGVAYVLPHTLSAENPQVNRFLVVFQEGNATKACLITPRRSNASTQLEREVETESILSQFDSTFFPSKTACINHSWRPDLEEGSTLDSFMRNASNEFSAVVIQDSITEEIESVATTAVATAEALQEARIPRSSGFSASDEAWLKGLDLTFELGLGREEGRRAVNAHIDLTTLFPADDVIRFADFAREEDPFREDK